MFLHPGAQGGNESRKSESTRLVADLGRVKGSNLLPIGSPTTFLFGRFGPPEKSTN